MGKYVCVYLMVGNYVWFMVVTTFLLFVTTTYLLILLSRKMAGNIILLRHCSSFLLVLVLLPLATSKSNVHVITTENFNEVQHGEWMLEL